MKVLQIAPLWFSVARNAPGGIESFLAQLLPALARRGCDVTLIASRDSSVTSALVPAIDVHLVRAMQEGMAAEYEYYEQHLLRLALRHGSRFDVVHSHVGPAAYVLAALPGIGARVLHTVHTPVTPDMAWFFAHHPQAWLSTVSTYQARKLEQAGARSCVAIPNGIDVEEFPFAAACGQGLVYLGRIESDKSPDLAIEVAQQLGAELTLAGPIVDHGFFRTAIEPHLNDRIRYVGVADYDQKVTLLGRAACALLPFRREEPFGLVAIESMACGTPVVALARGALPEIVEGGVSGFLAEREEDLAASVGRAIELDRGGVRAFAVARFGIERVADQYVALYERICHAAGLKNMPAHQRASR